MSASRLITSAIDLTSVRSARRPRVLFVGEAVTLAHVTRPWVLAHMLDPQHHEVHFACADRYDHLLGPSPFERTRLASIHSSTFLRRLSRGKPLYTREELRHYVAEDGDLLERLRPDVVVGDLRLSLSVSARLAGIPYIAITNAYWSPASKQPFPVPELSLTRTLGPRLGQLLFDLARPWAFARHARHLAALRAEHRLPPFQHGLLEAYTDGDLTLYADLPRLTPTPLLPAHHRYLGPVSWSPRGVLPPLLAGLPREQPIVYVSMGSSGCVRVLDRLISTLGALPLDSVIAGAGRYRPRQRRPNIWIADYLPGAAICERAKLVVCNGGSPSTYQALAAGKPVLGIPSNLDQHLNMARLVRRGVAIMLRSERLRAGPIRRAVRALLETPSYHEAAAKLAQQIRYWPTRQVFVGALDDALALRPKRKLPLPRVTAHTQPPHFASGWPAIRSERVATIGRETIAKR